MDAIQAAHGFSLTSEPVQHLFAVMSEFDREGQRQFLTFATGSPNLPVGGLRALQPKLTVVRKHVGDNPDGYLPSVMTCQNYLKLPPYTSKEVLAARLRTAVTEGCGSFHLS